MPKGKSTKNGKKRGPKCWQRPPDAELERYGKLGFNLAKIADSLGIAYNSLRKHATKDGSILAAIKRGKCARREEYLGLLEEIAKNENPRGLQSKLTAIIFSLKMQPEEELQKLRGTKLQQDIRASKAVQKKAELESRRLELEIRRLEGFETGSNEVTEI